MTTASASVTGPLLFGAAKVIGMFASIRHAISFALRYARGRRLRDSHHPDLGTAESSHETHETQSSGGGCAWCVRGRLTMNAGLAARPPKASRARPPHRSFTQSVGCAGFAFWDWINRRRA